MNIYLNIVFYQAIWFLCVLYGNFGALGGLVLLALHLMLSDRRAADAKMIVFFIAAGVLIDTAMQEFGILAFAAPSWLIPFWLIVIWAGLATLPLHSLRWMQGRHLINIFFGGLGGPLAYWGGVKLGGAEFPQTPSLSLAVLGVVWAVFWPLAMYLAARISFSIHLLDRAAEKG
ncbi:DUF2878 domain-containing protein [Desulfopila inferna]|uniref:DUF2878 domain-containing protein n=1 Tax=Desulfopila inferna TaxID=468528 RepID=UPI0019630BC4|nr:DUF2878 domain-containing protein [Desulfopila inferna]MBM9605324.1 DUF2878 domain-containing protein [Desulfopila inferna]